MAQRPGQIEKLLTYKAERDKANAPILALLNANENLLLDHQAQLERVKDMYQSGIIEKKELVERKVRLEETIEKLETEKGKWLARLEPLNLVDSEIEQVVNFARTLNCSLGKADKDFTARRVVIEMLDVRGTLAVEDGEKAVYVTLRLTGDEQPTRLSVSNWPKMQQELVVCDSRKDGG
jgi:ribosome-binding ATPase YchF (GTP1/OBG family)